jgi:hypothetical protein
MLHNKEYHAICELFRQCRKAIDEVLSKSDIYKRTQGYINLANDNIEVVEKQIKRNNHFYEGTHSFKFYFDKGSLITSFYEIALSYRDARDNYRHTSLGIDSFIILLDECGLIKDNIED